MQVLPALHCARIYTLLYLTYRNSVNYDVLVFQHCSDSYAVNLILDRHICFLTATEVCQICYNFTNRNFLLLLRLYKALLKVVL